MVMKVPTPADHLALYAEANGYLYGQSVTQARAFMNRAKAEPVAHIKQEHLGYARHWAEVARKYYDRILFP